MDINLANLARKSCLHGGGIRRKSSPLSASGQESSKNLVWQPSWSSLGSHHLPINRQYLWALVMAGEGESNHGVPDRSEAPTEGDSEARLNANDPAKYLTI